MRKIDEMRSPARRATSPDYLSPPGDTLKETIASLGLDTSELADSLGLSQADLDGLIQGSVTITDSIASRLEDAVNIPASFWRNRERQYREAQELDEAIRPLEEHKNWLQEFPVRKLIDYGWIAAYDAIAYQVHELFKYFDVSSPDGWRDWWSQKQAQVVFRRSPATESNPGPTSAWIRRGEIRTMPIQCDPFDIDAFRGALKKVRALTLSKPDHFCGEVEDLCRQAGVAVGFVRELPNAPINGARCWPKPGHRASLLLSLRFKSNDQLWFTFFHEAGHILLDAKRSHFTGPDVSYKGDEDQINRFAEDILIPRDKYQTFTTSGGRMSRVRVHRFAESIGIHPGIVVGRLQKDGHLPMNHLQDEKARYEWADDC